MGSCRWQVLGPQGICEGNEPGRTLKRGKRHHFLILRCSFPQSAAHTTRQVLICRITGHVRLRRLSGLESVALGATITVDMKQKIKARSPYTAKPKRNYPFPVPIPPCSVVAVRRGAGKKWANKAGRVFRVGYYSKMDGLDCIWLVDETGSYAETIDHDCLERVFEVRSVAKERSLYGRGRPKFPSLLR
jgi:hypothetical protein